MVMSESSFGAYVCLRRPAGLHRDEHSCAVSVGFARIKTFSDRKGVFNMPQGIGLYFCRRKMQLCRYSAL